LAAAPEWDSGFAGTVFNGTEDSVFSYNFSQNVSDADNDSLTFEIKNISSDVHGLNPVGFFHWISINESTGILSVNATLSNESAYFNISIDATDGFESAGARKFFFNITPVNDPPVFVGLFNTSFNYTENPFEYIINITDEESDTPYDLNITFLSCDTAEWSDRADTNCVLFNSSYYDFNSTSGVLNISFNPTRNDVGRYDIQFNVTDTGSPNATTVEIVNFTVLNINAAPYFGYSCDSERTATEDSFFECVVNVTDIDEVNNLTFSANHTWFLFSSTNTSTASFDTNLSTDFNATAVVGFTPIDERVGNWSINITVVDTGSPVKSNSSVFWFLINNVNDSVFIANISNLTAYTSENYTLSFNATDDDLKIPVHQESFYNESLVFSSNESWVSVQNNGEIAGTNVTSGLISFDPNDAPSLGNYTVNVTVHDANNYSYYSRLFTIFIEGNTAPSWNASTVTEHTLTEDVAFYLNLSLNVSDAEQLDLNFTYANRTRFDGFTFDTDTGEIDFTPTDVDVGEQLVEINVSDGVSTDSLTFNFTVTNVNDAGSIETPISVVNASVDSNSNMNVSEDNKTTVVLFVSDDDYKIPKSQTGFYNETVSINLTILGKNSSLFNFSFTSIDRTLGRARYDAVFTPRKADLGNYNISINITDFSNSSDYVSFNLTVLPTEHSPELAEIENITTSINTTVYLDFNFTDTEDVNETFTGGNATYTLTNLTVGGNFLTINSSTGVMNLTTNSSLEGFWEYQVLVNDSAGFTDSQIFSLKVYGYPKVIFPDSGFLFNLKENVSSNLSFRVNDTVSLSTGETLTYTLWLRNESRNQTSGYGNDTLFIWGFSPNFTEETTCSGNLSFILNVSNPFLSNTSVWNITINHTNYPLRYSGNIGGGDYAISGGSPQQVLLSDYFTDLDAVDSCTNQTIGFSYSLVNGSDSGTISVVVTNWTNGTAPSINFSTSSSGSSANYSII
jgi:hypothetical protein